MLTFGNMSAHDDCKSSIEGRGMEKSTSTSIQHIEKSHGTIVEFDDSIEDTKPSKSVWLITFTVAMGGFLFGR
jgi:SP family myo-inositol transporter-like MFS transporter 13